MSKELYPYRKRCTLESRKKIKKAPYLQINNQDTRCILVNLDKIELPYEKLFVEFDGLRC